MWIPDRFQDIEGWFEQYRRVERWRNRLLEILRTSNGMLARDDFDSVYAFFQASHCLRDWMTNSGSATPDELSDLWASSEALRLGEDISNNSKHYVRNGRVRVTARLGFQREFAPVNGEDGERWSVVWIDQEAGLLRYDLEQLVRDCFDAWSDFCALRLSPKT